MRFMRQSHQPLFLILCCLIFCIRQAVGAGGARTAGVDQGSQGGASKGSLLHWVWAAAQQQRHWEWPLIQHQHEGTAAAAAAAEGGSSTGAHSQLLSSRRGRQLLTSHRIAGVGTGIFIFFLFLAFCVCLCIIGSRTKIPWVIFTVSTTILVIVILALFTPPRGEPPEPPATGYDSTIDGLIAVMVLLCVGILAGALGMVALVAAEQRYARPLSYHLDIDQTW